MSTLQQLLSKPPHQSDPPERVRGWYEAVLRAERQEAAASKSQFFWQEQSRR